MHENEQLQEQLKSLHGIRPDALFLARARVNLLTAIAPATSPYGKGISLETFLPTFRLAFAMGTLSFFLFLGAYQSPYGQTGAVASLNTDAIQAERPKTNAHYFNGISPVISLALTDIADPSTNWGSANQVKQSIALLYKNN